MSQIFQQLYNRKHLCNMYLRFKSIKPHNISVDYIKKNMYIHTGMKILEDRPQCRLVDYELGKP